MINKSSTSHPVDVHVGSKLRSRRQELGISQEELAEHVDLTFQQIQKYEKGYNRISCSRLYEFAKFLGTTISYFFDDLEPTTYGFPHYSKNQAELAEPLHKLQASYNTLQDKDTVRLLAAFMSIEDPKTKESVIHLVEKISSEEGSK